MSDAILAGNVVETLLILNDILNRGFEGQYIISGISNHFRDLLVCKDAATAQLFQVGASIRDRYIAMAKRCSNEFLYQAIEISNECDLNYRLSKNKRLLLELTLIRLCQLPKSESASAVKTEKKRSMEPIATGEKPPQTNVRQERIPEREKVSEKEDILKTEKLAEKEYNPQRAGVKEENRSESTLQEDEIRYRQSDVSKTPESDLQKPAENNVQKPGSNDIRKSADAIASLKKRTVSLSGMGVSLSSISNRETEETTSTGPATQQHNGTNLFTEKELVDAWEKYAKNLNEEKLLKNTMTLYHPKMLSATLFEVEVNTELNKQYLTDHSLGILSFLREKLGNGDITMTIRIAEVNAIKKPLTSREIFDEMVEQNPSLQKLSDEFGLELS